MDDFSANILTTGILPIAGSAVSGVNETKTDWDWFRAELQPHVTYEFVVEPVGDPAKTNLTMWVFDRVGRRRERFVTNRSLGTRPRYQAENQTTRYFGIAGGVGGYSISLNVVDDFGSDLQNYNWRGFIGSKLDYGNIETSGDRDWHRVWLQRDQSLVFNVLGSQVVNGLTLRQPQLELRDSNGDILAADYNEDGDSRAWFEYTAPNTGYFYLDVASSTSATGTYAILIPGYDDYDAGVSTLGRVDVNGPAINANAFNHQDTDWYRFELKNGYAVRFRTNVQNTSYQVYDYNGSVVDDFGHFFENQTGIGSFFVAVDTAEAGDYQFWIEQYDWVGDGVYSSHRLSPDSTVIGAIDSATDQDWYRPGRSFGGVELLNNIEYSFRVNSDDGLVDPIIRVTNANGDVLAESTTNSPTSARLAFKPDYDVRARVVVLSGSESQGRYRLNMDFEDNAGIGSRNAIRRDFTDGFARINGANEFENDIDWFKVRLKKGTVYELRDSSQDKFSVMIRNPNNQIVAFSRQGTVVRYTPNTTGDHYFIQRTDFEGVRARWYDLVLSERFRTEYATEYYLEPAVGADGGGFLYQSTELFGEIYEVISDVRLRYLSDGNEVEVPSNKRFRLSPSQWRTLRPVATADGNYEMFARAYDLSNAWTNWTNMPITVRRRPGYGPSEETVSHFGREITYFMPDQLPDYYAGDTRLSGFTPFNAQDRGGLSLAMGGWETAIGVNFVPVDDIGSAEIVLFKSSFDGIALTNAPGSTPQAGDIILNSDSPLFDGSQNYLGAKQNTFELVRALGVSLGLREVDHTDRLNTVMGRRKSDATQGLSLYPTMPLPNDISAAWRYGESEIDSVRDVDLFVEDQFDVARAYASSNHLRVIPPGRASAHIDLRRGAYSFIDQADERIGITVTDMNTTFHSATTGNGADFIGGNEVDNFLRAGAGADVLMGRQGADRLFGEFGNDTYIYRPGDGHDEIYEDPFFKGFDTLEIQGRYNLNSLSDDLSFQKYGDELVVRLELDGRHTSEQIIRIYNSAGDESAVERLILSNPQGFRQIIDLNSISAQTTDTKRQYFEVTGTRTAFGLTVTPA